MPNLSWWRQLRNTVAVIFVMAVLGNYPWELAQARLYAGMRGFRSLGEACVWKRAAGGTHLDIS